MRWPWFEGLAAATTEDGNLNKLQLGRIDLWVTVDLAARC